MIIAIISQDLVSKVTKFHAGNCFVKRKCSTNEKKLLIALLTIQNDQYEPHSLHFGRHKPIYTSLILFLNLNTIVSHTKTSQNLIVDPNKC